MECAPEQEEVVAKRDDGEGDAHGKEGDGEVDEDPCLVKPFHQITVKGVLLHRFSMPMTNFRASGQVR